jgi:hypothetical protein
MALPEKRVQVYLRGKEKRHFEAFKSKLGVSDANAIRAMIKEHHEMKGKKTF